MFPNLRRLLCFATLALAPGCDGTNTDGSKDHSDVQSIDAASRLALARQDDALVLIELNLETEAHEVLTPPISDWFRVVDGYSVGGASAQLWASRDHTRAVMFGSPHEGGGRRLNVLRAGKWESWDHLEHLRDVLVAPSARLIVTNAAERAELFSEGTLRVFDYAGNELLNVGSRNGLSTVGLAPDGSWVLVEDQGEAAIVHENGKTIRFKPDLGPAGETELGWAVSAVFADRIVFHGYAEDEAGDVVYPRVTHQLDGSKVPSELTDYQRIADKFVLTPGRELYVVGSQGFVPVSKLPADFDVEEREFIASGNGLTLTRSGTELSWLDMNGKVAASYSPELLLGSDEYALGTTALYSLRAGLTLVSHAAKEGENTTTVDAFRLDASRVTSERLATLPVDASVLYFGVKPSSPWIAWAAVDSALSGDLAGAYNLETREQAELDDLPRIEAWADYGEPAAHAP